MFHVEYGSVTGNPGFGPQPPPSPSPSNQTTSTNVGVIAGAAGGGVAALLFIVGLVVFCVHRERLKSSIPETIPLSNPKVRSANGTGIFTSPNNEIYMSFCFPKSPTYSHFGWATM